MAILGANGGTRVGVGVVGVGDAWPTHAGALRNLAARVRVVAVADAVPLRAEAAAADVGAVAAGGILALARRPDVRAVLLGDPAWWGLSALDLLLTAEKPVLLAGPTDPFDDRLDALAARAASTGAVVVPDVSRRFSPGTLRLRELAATTLGAVHAVRVLAPRADPSPLAASYGQPTHAARFAELADWCAHLLPDPVRGVAATADPAAAAGTVELRCAAGSPVTGDRAGGAGATITLADADDLAGADAAGRAVVTCDRGAATLTGGDELKIAVPGEPDRVEDLSAERPGFETLLTLFLRKAVGGLIPAPDLHDLSAAMTFCRVAAASAGRGEPVELSAAGEGRVRPR